LSSVAEGANLRRLQQVTEFVFRQVDVFASQPLRGNPLAVVVGADALTDTQVAAFANWTNLSETTFPLRPTSPLADYRVRIFTPRQELPFAGPSHARQLPRVARLGRMGRVHVERDGPKRGSAARSQRASPAP
jgi:Phenazine biosynthesis-like protein